jgi:cytochrome b6-f complex iron-sulfur subunit
MSDLNRRDFVTAAAGVAEAACACCMCEEAHAAEAAAAPSGPVDVGTKADFPKDGTINDKLAKPKELRILVVRNEGKIYAMNSTCTHKNCAVKAQTDPAKIEKGPIVCPCHGSGYSLQGTAIKGPAKGSLFRYGISEKDGKLLVDKSKQYPEKEWGDPGAFVRF